MKRKKRSTDILEAKMDRLTRVVGKGFAATEKGFAAVAEDIESLRTDNGELKGGLKKIGDRLTAVESKLGGIDNRIDNESFARRDLETRVQKILPTLPRSTERA